MALHRGFCISLGSFRNVEPSGHYTQIPGPAVARDNPIVVPADPLSLREPGYEPDTQARHPRSVSGSSRETAPSTSGNASLDTLFLLFVNNFYFLMAPQFNEPDVLKVPRISQAAR
jgi:hypothetical protein